MSAEDNIDMLKQIPPLSEYEKKRRWRTSFMLAFATAVSVLFLIYAFMQKMEADKQAATAQKFRIEAEVLQSLAEKQRMAAEKAREEAVMAQQEAERQRQLAEQALVNCEGNKRK